MCESLCNNLAIVSNGIGLGFVEPEREIQVVREVEFIRGCQGKMLWLYLLDHVNPILGCSNVFVPLVNVSPDRRVEVDVAANGAADCLPKLGWLLNAVVVLDEGEMRANNFSGPALKEVRQHASKELLKLVPLNGWELDQASPAPVRTEQ